MSLSCAKARAEARIIRSSSLSHDSRSSRSSQLNGAADESAESLRAACDKGNSCGRAVEKARPFPFVKSYAQKHAAGRSTNGRNQIVFRALWVSPGGNAAVRRKTRGRALER